MPLPVLLSLPSHRFRSGHVVVEEEVRGSTRHSLRSNLNEEVQQGDTRPHYSHLLARSKKWERAVQLKDSALRHLQQALEDRDIALKKQDKLIEETKQRLIFQGKSEKAQLEKKELEVSLLKARNIQQAEKLAEQAEQISVLNSQQEKREQQLVAYTNHVKRKVENLKGRLQNAEASLHLREEELEAHKRCCNDLKLVIWKKDRMLEKSKLVEGQLQSALKRKHMVCQALEVANNELQGENSYMAKTLREMRRDSEASEVAVQQDLKMQALCLQRQKQQIHRLEMILSQKESCLYAKSMELEASHKETKRLVEEYNELNKKYESLNHAYVQLQIKLTSIENKMNITQNCAAIYQDHPNQGYEIEDAEFSRKLEALARTRMSTPWLDRVIPQNCSSHGVSLIERGAKPGKGRNLPSFGRGSLDDQVCLSNELKTRIDCPSAILNSDAEQCQVEGNGSPRAFCPLARSLNTCFPNVGSTTHYEWRFSNRLTDDISCMETKAEFKDSTDPVPSNTSLELQKIQEEIRERERSWKQIEASMRAELSRRKVQLHEANIL